MHTTPDHKKEEQLFTFVKVFSKFFLKVIFTQISRLFIMEVNLIFIKLQQGKLNTDMGNCHAMSPSRPVPKSAVEHGISKSSTSSPGQKTLLNKRI